jgi:hypothetical protein
MQRSDADAPPAVLPIGSLHACDVCMPGAGGFIARTGSPFMQLQR